MDTLEIGKKKKILALDGGGIKGIITIEILAKIEKELRLREGNEDSRSW